MNVIGPMATIMTEIPILRFSKMNTMTECAMPMPLVWYPIKEGRIVGYLHMIYGLDLQAKQEKRDSFEWNKLQEKDFQLYEEVTRKKQKKGETINEISLVPICRSEAVFPFS